MQLFLLLMSATLSSVIYRGQSGCVPTTKTLLCNSTCNKCSQITKCERKCTYCKDGYLGRDCESECDGNCRNSRCELSKSGNRFKCLEGCKPGWMGPMCKHECNYPCSECRLNGECVKCKDGHYGYSCQYDCQPLCKICMFRTGVCTVCRFGKVKNVTNTCLDNITKPTNDQETGTELIKHNENMITTVILESITLPEETRRNKRLENQPADNKHWLEMGTLAIVIPSCVVFTAIIVGIPLLIYNRKKVREGRSNSISEHTDYLTPSPISANIYDEIDDTHIVTMRDEMNETQTGDQEITVDETGDHLQHRTEILTVGGRVEEDRQLAGFGM